MKIYLYRFTLVILVFIITSSCKKDSPKAVFEEFLASDFVITQENEMFFVGTTPNDKLCIIHSDADGNVIDKIEFDKAISLPLKIFPIDFKEDLFYLTSKSDLFLLSLKDKKVEKIFEVNLGNNVTSNVNTFSYNLTNNFCFFYNIWAEFTSNEKSFYREFFLPLVVNWNKKNQERQFIQISKTYDVYPISMIDYDEKILLLLHFKNSKNHLSHFALFGFEEPLFFFHENEDRIPVKLLKINNEKLLILTNLSSTSTQNHDVFVYTFKGNENTDTLIITGNEDEIATDAILKDNYLFITGYVNNISGKNNCFIYKVDLQTNLIWKKIFNISSDTTVKIFSSNDNFLYLIGETKVNKQDKTSKWISKINMEGITEWSVTLPENIIHISDLKVSNNLIKIIAIEKNEKFFQPVINLYLLSKKGEILGKKNLLKDLNFGEEEVYPSFGKFIRIDFNSIIGICGLNENNNIFYFVALNEHELSFRYSISERFNSSVSVYPYSADQVRNELYIFSNIKFNDFDVLLPFMLNINLKKKSIGMYPVYLENIPQLVSVAHIASDTFVTLNEYYIRKKTIYSLTKIKMQSYEILDHVFLNLDSNLIPQTISFFNNHFILTGYTEKENNFFICLLNNEGKICEIQITDHFTARDLIPTILTQDKFIYVGFTSPPNQENDFYHPTILKFSPDLKLIGIINISNKIHEILTSMKLSPNQLAITTIRTTIKFTEKNRPSQDFIWLYPKKNYKTYLYTINLTNFELVH